MNDAETTRIHIRGGTVYDGSGADPLCADLAVQGGRIRTVAPRLPAGDLSLEADGCIVCPGFIDVHGHSDLTLLLLPGADSRLYDGVTTEVCGNCGYSGFPLDEALQRRRERGLQPLAGPDRAFEIDWRTGAELVARAEREGCAINRVLQVGHGTLRAVAMGEEARQPEPHELARMRQLLRQSLQHAVGMSSGLAYPPGGWAERPELEALARMLRRSQKLYTSHIRDEGDALEDSIEEALEVGRVAGAVQLSHLKTMWPRNWHKIGWLRRRLATARREGIDLTADRYPYKAASTDLDYILPGWLSEGGVKAELARLRSETVRGALRAHMQELTDRTPDFWTRVVVSRTHSGRPLPSPSNGEVSPEGRSITEIALLTRLPAWRVVVDLLVRERTRVDTIYHAMCEENLREILSWPFVMIGSDSGVKSIEGPLSRGRPHPRAFGTFARFLSRYSDLAGGGGIPLPEAIHRVTGMPARRFGLTDRGRIARGMAADVVVFDPVDLTDMSTFEEPLQYSRGVRHLLVGGVPVIHEGRRTGKLPGRVLRPRRCYPIAWPRIVPTDRPESVAM